jgi:hypothetical protein
MGLFDWLKSLITDTSTPPHEYVPSALTFVELDIPALAQKLQLKQEGEQRGRNNQPSASQSTLDSAEARIATAIQSELAIAHERFALHMRAYGERESAVQVQGKFAQLETQAEAARADFATHLSHGKDLIWKLKNDVEHRYKELQSFRTENQLERDAHIPESQILHWGIIAVLVLIESLLNGQLLARGIEMGLLGGVTYALVIAILNVGIGYAAGSYLFRNVNHLRGYRKAVGFTSIMVWMASAFAFNLLVAHYRAALGGSNPGEAERMALLTFTTAPFAIKEMSGWLLFLLGCSFSLIAAADGWKMDDPYPGYGHLSRRFNHSYEDYTSEKQELMSELEEIKNAAIATLDDLSLEVEKGGTQYRNIRANQTHLIEQFEGHIDYLQKCGNELLSIYRQANTAARSSPEPEHFTTEWVLTGPVDYKNDLNSADSDIDTRIATTFEGIRATRLQILRDYQAALQEFRSIEFLVTKEAKADAAISSP